uniref:Uncharacterized protein n=1 Tax=Ciona savignyi TaxID=51511 RepID=H2ZE94_CIOSA
MDRHHRYPYNGTGYLPRSPFHRHGEDWRRYEDRRSPPHGYPQRFVQRPPLPIIRRSVTPPHSPRYRSPPRRDTYNDQPGNLDKDPRFDSPHGYNQSIHRKQDVDMRDTLDGLPPHPTTSPHYVHRTTEEPRISPRRKLDETKRDRGSSRSQSRSRHKHRKHKKHKRSRSSYRKPSKRFKSSKRDFSSHSDTESSDIEASDTSPPTQKSSGKSSSNLMTVKDLAAQLSENRRKLKEEEERGHRKRKHKHHKRRKEK